MRKLLAITWRELYTHFTDRTLLIITLLAPLGISVVVGLAFGGLGSGASPVDHIPVLVINQDGGNQQIGSMSEPLVDLLVEGNLDSEVQGSLVECTVGEEQEGEQSQSLDDLIDGQVLDAALIESLVVEGKLSALDFEVEGEDSLIRAGRTAVDQGLYAALVIIPEDFSDSMATLADSRADIQTVELEIYANQGQMLAAGIVRSVVEGIVSQFASGNIAIGTTLETVVEQDPQLLAGADQDTISSLFACAFMPSGDLVALDIEPLQSAAEDNQASGILVAVGSAQGMFFALFTGQFGILSVYEERKNWTLQRLVSTPTPRWTILGGKLIGVMARIIFQLTALMLALTFVGSLMVGDLLLIWGNQFDLLALLLLAVGTAVGGLGMLLAGLLRSIEQANIVVSVLNIALGVLGGTFGFALPVEVAWISMIHWGREAFELLAAGQSDIWLHLAILFGQGLVLFSIGLFVFNRRFEVT